jgi:hypothetical protein
MPLLREFHFVDASAIITARYATSCKVRIDHDRPSISVQGVGEQPFDDTFSGSDLAGRRYFGADLVWEQVDAKGLLSHRYRWDSPNAHLLDVA